MFRNQFCRVKMIFNYSSELQLRAAKTEVHRWFLGLLHKLRQIIARTEPCQNTVAFPAPRNDFFSRKIGGQMPVVFQRILFYTSMQAVVIPAQCYQHSLL